MVRNQRFESIGQFRRTRCAITSQGDGSEPNHNLANQRTIQTIARSGKPGCRRRVRVHNSVHVGPHPVNHQVHANLARDSTLARKPLPVHVYNHHVRSAHPTLADAGRGYQEASFVEPDRQVSIGSRNKTVFVQQAAELHNLETMLPIAASSHWPLTIESLLKPCADMVPHASEPLQPPEGQYM